jgi:hypothetical protein
MVMLCLRIRRHSGIQWGRCGWLDQRRWRRHGRFFHIDEFRWSFVQCRDRADRRNHGEGRNHGYWRCWGDRWNHSDWRHPCDRWYRRDRWNCCDWRHADDRRHKRGRWHDCERRHPCDWWLVCNRRDQRRYQRDRTRQPVHQWAVRNQSRSQQRGGVRARRRPPHPPPRVKRHDLGSLADNTWARWLPHRRPLGPGLQRKLQHNSHCRDRRAPCRCADACDRVWHCIQSVLARAITVHFQSRCRRGRRTGRYERKVLACSGGARRCRYSRFRSWLSAWGTSTGSRQPARLRFGFRRARRNEFEPHAYRGLQHICPTGTLSLRRFGKPFLLVAARADPAARREDLLLFPHNLHGVELLRQHIHQTPRRGSRGKALVFKGC